MAKANEPGRSLTSSTNALPSLSQRQAIRNVDGEPGHRRVASDKRRRNATGIA
jgi:hypothetical protein